MNFDLQRLLDEAKALVDDSQGEAWEAEKIRRKYKERLEQAGVPALLQQVIAKPDETPAVQAAREFVASDKPILLLTGGTGTGKSVAAALVIALLGGRFETAFGLSRFNRYDGEAMRDLERCNVLVIDDLGLEYSDVKGAWASFFDSLLNVRYVNGRRTVLNTNMLPKEFRARYGDRVADRIRQSGRVVTLAGESLRRRK